MLAERPQHQLRVGGDLDRLAERRRQLLDPPLGALLRREVVEVLLHRLGQLVALLDPLQPRLQHAGEAEIGVAGRVGAAQLGAGRALLAGVVERHPDQRRAVAPRPGQVDGRLVAGDQPLVGVDPLREERRDLTRVLELAGDERLRRGGEEVLVVGVEEGVAAVLGQRLVDVHPGAVLAEQRLRHEGRVTAVFQRVLFDDDPVGHAVVGHRQRVLVAHVDLVLGGADLVMGVLDVDAHLLQRQHRLAAQVGAGVQRGQVEVAALVEDLGHAARRFGGAEVEVLQLGADVVGVEAEVLGALQGAAQDPARVTLVGVAAGHTDVAEHAGDRVLLLGAPGDQREGREIGHRDHVRLLDRVEAGDRGAVEAHAAVEGVLQLGGVDREALQLPQHIGEPEADEADVALLDDLGDVSGALRFLCHSGPPCLFSAR